MKISLHTVLVTIFLLMIGTVAVRYMIQSAKLAPALYEAPKLIEKKTGSDIPPPAIAKDGEPTVVDWRMLRDLNYQTGERTPALDALNGKIVQIPGFMVPLEDYLNKVSEFLLVPSPQACIHVPPPPPNQMVFIKMSKTSTAKVAYVPIWVIGKFHIQNNDSPYGKVSFYIEADAVKDFAAPGE